MGSHELAGFQESGVARGGVVMVMRNNGTLEIIGGGNIHAALVSEEVVTHLEVGKAGSQVSGDVVVKGLQVL